MFELLLPIYGTRRLVQAGSFKNILWPFIDIIGYMSEVNYEVEEI